MERCVLVEADLGRGGLRKRDWVEIWGMGEGWDDDFDLMGVLGYGCHGFLLGG